MYEEISMKKLILAIGLLIHSNIWSASVLIECNYEESLRNVSSPIETYRNIDVDDYCHYLWIDEVYSKNYTGDFPDDFCMRKKTRSIFFDEEQQTIELKENGVWTKYKTKDFPRSCDQRINDDMSLCLDRWVYVNIDNGEISFRNMSQYAFSFCPSREQVWDIDKTENEELKKLYQENCPSLGSIVGFGFDWMGNSLGFDIDRNTGEYSQNRKEGRVYYDKKSDGLKRIDKVNSYGGLFNSKDEEVGSCKVSTRRF